MPVDLGDPEWIVLVADADTPEDLRKYAGRMPGIPAGVVLPPDGKIDSITISGLTVWGYLRWSAAGFHEWVLSAPVNPNVAAVNAIPARGEWTSTDARQVYYDIGSALLGLGVPGPNLRAGLKQLYNAAVTDAGAAIRAGYLPAIGPD